MGQSSELLVKDIKLADAKLITSVDSTQIGVNLSELKNMFYTDAGLEGVGGMTKINTSVMNATYFKARNAFHYKREQPEGSFVLAQSWNTGETASVLLSNKAVIPATGNFESSTLWTDGAGAETGRFSNTPNEYMAYCNGVENLIYGGDEASIAGFINFDAAGTYRYDHTEIINNTKSDDANSIVIGGVADREEYFYIGSLIPIDGFKVYINEANQATSTMVVEYWNGSAWAGVTTFVDGTTAGGISLAQTGNVSFDSTQDLVKIKNISQVFIYWYRIFINDVTSGTKFYYITESIPFQEIKDIWDGYPRTTLSCFYVDNGVYKDNTFNIYEEDYSSGSAFSFLDVSSFIAADDKILFGFPEQIVGLDFMVASENTNASVATVSYWNGVAWVALTIADGTTSGGGNISLEKNGTISWGQLASGVEFKLGLVTNDFPFYYYKLTFSANLSATVHIDRVTGIPAQAELGTYKFPFHAQDRLWLCGNVSEDKNSVICSAQGTSVVFSGEDSIPIYFGDNNEIVGAVSLYSQFGSTLYDVMVFLKNYETWIVVGNSPSNWVKYRASNKIGCVAPLTISTIHAEFEVIPGLNKHVAIWQNSDGIYLFDGRTFFPIHRDIGDLFDKRNTSGLTSGMKSKSTAFFNEQKQEYHWLCATGVGTTSLNREFVFSFLKQRWYEIDRGSGKKLQVGITVNEIGGNKHLFGFIDTGYMERLDYGNTFDGVDISQSFKIGDLQLGESFLEESQVRGLRLTGKAKTSTSNEISVGYYVNGEETAKNTRTLSPLNSGKSVFQTKQKYGDGKYTLHSLKFSLITNDESKGFEPYVVSIMYKNKGFVFD